MLALFGCDPAGPGNGGTVQDVTIYQIQQGEIAENSGVRVTGVIATSPMSQNGNAFFVEDPAGGQYSGIMVYVQDPTGLAIVQGDELTITGTYVEYFGLSEIIVDDISGINVTGTGAIPAVAVVLATEIATGGTLAEAYEGVLVRVFSVSGASDPDGDGEWTVTGSLIIDDLFYSAAGTNGVNYISITGCLYFGSANFKLEPRSAGDLAIS